MEQNVHRLVSGMVAGAGATILMSVVMLIGQRVGRVGKLPPKKIVEAAVDATGLPHPKDQTLNLLTAGAHLGYGIAAGMVYSAARRPHARVPPVVSGILFAVGVWAASYEGWVPSLGIMPPARCDRPARTSTMILAHLVYGAVLGLTQEVVVTFVEDHPRIGGVRLQRIEHGK